MTREEVLAMEPGRELDALVAEKVMGKSVSYTALGLRIVSEGTIDVIDMPTYSTDLSAAWEVMEKFYYVDVRKVDGVKWAAWIGRGDGYSHNAKAETAPEAICKAALLSLIEEETP